MNSAGGQVPLLDKRRFRNAFERAASRYERAAVLQREVGARLLERLDYIRIDPGCIVDLGSGPGLCTGLLGKRYKSAEVVALDLAPAMVTQARQKLSWWEKPFSKQHFLCADAERLPLADRSVDFIFSNLTLQWCRDLEQTFAELHRVLKPNGLLMFTTMGPDTLKELRESWRAADDRIHVHPFLDMHDIGDALMRSRFADPVMDMEYLTVTYQDARTLMRDLKTIGAHNAAESRNRGMTGKARLKSMLAHYETYRRDGQLPATYEIVYGQAWMPPEKPQGGEIPVQLHPQRR
jgi:malonyl-CoA O-methyltransferase